MAAERLRAYQDFLDQLDATDMWDAFEQAAEERFPNEDDLARFYRWYSRKDNGYRIANHLDQMTSVPVRRRDLWQLWYLTTRHPTPFIELGYAVDGRRLRVAADELAIAAPTPVVPQLSRTGDRLSRTTLIRQRVHGLQRLGGAESFAFTTIGRVVSEHVTSTQWVDFGFVLVKRIGDEVGGYYLVAEMSQSSPLRMDNMAIPFSVGRDFLVSTYRGPPFIAARVDTDEPLANWEGGDVLSYPVTLFAAEVVTVERDSVQGDFVRVD